MAEFDIYRRYGYSEEQIDAIREDRDRRFREYEDSRPRRGDPDREPDYETMHENAMESRAGGDPERMYEAQLDRPWGDHRPFGD